MNVNDIVYYYAEKGIKVILILLAILSYCLALMERGIVGLFFFAFSIICIVVILNWRT